MNEASSVKQVLSEFSIRGSIADLETLGAAGGFSGAQFWRVTIPPDRWCLRRWPKEHPDESRLRYIHAVLQHVAQDGFGKIPLPVASQNGATIVAHAGHFWELTRWMPGRADYRDNPNRTRLAAAMRALAEFHRRAAAVPFDSPKVGSSPGIATRRQQVEQLLGGELDEISRSVLDNNWPELALRARQILNLFQATSSPVLPALQRMERQRLDRQSCIRDIWHDHVLFDGDEVSGIVDFGAMNVESVAGDVARLLGSLVEDDTASWSHGLEAYQTIRPLSQTEFAMIQTFDKANVILSGISWLRWIYVQGRQFEDRARIVDRLDHVIRRMTFIRDAT